MGRREIPCRPQSHCGQLSVFIIGMLRGHRLQAIKNERKLETNQMFAPRGLVIIESAIRSVG